MAAPPRMCAVVGVSKSTSGMDEYAMPSTFFEKALAKALARGMYEGLGSPAPRSVSSARRQSVRHVRRSRSEMELSSVCMTSRKTPRRALPKGQRLFAKVSGWRTVSAIQRHQRGAPGPPSVRVVARG